MGRRKKALAAIVPAFALVATAAGTPPAGAAPIGGRAVLAAEPSDPPSSDPPTADPTADPSTGPSADPTAEPPGGPSAEPSTEPPADPSAPPPDEPTAAPPQERNQGGQGIKQGPNRNQFADIRRAPRVRQPGQGRGGSRGTFTSNCGRNEGQRHSNPDNVIVAPGVQNGAHHIHDYVGNESTDGFSTDQSLAAAGTTCTNGDKSTYYWPVVRLRAGKDGSDAAGQSRQDGNVGSVVTPSSVQLRFTGNARSRVTAMPEFMRIVTGDAKAGTNGTGNARSQWTCTGFQDRAFTDKYPLCPRGSRVMRVLNFPSCWDGRNSDSANHRDHVVFPDQRTGACPPGRRAVPQLRMTLTYSVPARALAFALDTFPEQGHDPVTDHGDFINVMSPELMRRAVGCVNSGRRC
ncbi:DUF1996 domain-containing protein [Actinomadura terrae]|uniref:DUF1996 domain-containing protein n=1 Tax=Actinomadura terrae TaxID=604353 RepID=UPI001FA7CAF6|nr:DUF1996 domain-containing protein [Actinomadura terrae]